MTASGPGDIWESAPVSLPAWEADWMGYARRLLCDTEHVGANGHALRLARLSAIAQRWWRCRPRIGSARRLVDGGAQVPLLAISARLGRVPDGEGSFATVVRELVLRRRSTLKTLEEALEVRPDNRRAGACAPALTCMFFGGGGRI